MLSGAEDEAALRSGIRSLLLPGQEYLHHYNEGAKRRIEIAYALAEFDFHGAVLVTRVTGNNHQEPARARLLGWLLPRLQHTERVDHVLIESRHGGDKHDRRTVRLLQRSHQITSQLTIHHLRKRADERLWVADFVMGAYVSAHLHGEGEPWEVLTNAHVIDVVREGAQKTRNPGSHCPAGGPGLTRAPAEPGPLPAASADRLACRGQDATQNSAWHVTRSEDLGPPAPGSG
ncbi:hypothetical protein [Streptoalloteichus tenebrarius]|uniref:hypothetical protein n=1 Tax=Streptoalloteichus tenebrarius (strain ATCC 17920 / DSM 40477 / JCM 4838 / CBS 697.72 / NBRC 16177 / NCIMB 11028 / NRRL B-12390 / A12253. 1 / ISP 5477) TaxID=1933 RepID=UPI0020A30B82|nr:hypothetical protein [Streptoalloteichus tenebrarius]